MGWRRYCKHIQCHKNIFLHLAKELYRHLFTPEQKQNSDSIYFGSWYSADSLEVALREKGQIYWQILIGDINLPREPAVNANGQTEDQSMRLQSEFADYESIRFGFLLVLRFTVEPNVQSLLMGTRCPKTAWETLKMEYCPTPWKVVHELFEKLMNMKYRENGNHRIFLRRFRELVQKLKTETIIPSWLETSAFLRALSDSPSLHALMY